MQLNIQKQSKLTISIIAIATIVSLSPLIKFPACLITLIFIVGTIGYKVSKPKSSFRHDHRSFLNGETADIFVNYLCKLKEQTQIDKVSAAWDEKSTNNIVLGINFIICYKLSTLLSSYHRNQNMDLGTMIVLSLISLLSIIFENFIFTLIAVTCAIVFGLLFSTKDIAQVDVGKWTTRKTFHNTINQLKKSVELESAVYQWIQIQDKISSNELKFIPVICKKLGILPDNLAVRFGTYITDQKYYSELIKENDVHLFNQNYRAVLAIVCENEDVFESNGYIEIPEMCVSLSDLGEEFVGKMYRTYIKVLVNQDQMFSFDFNCTCTSNYCRMIREAIANIE